MQWTSIALGLALWAGCYAPQISAGTPCSANGTCPSGEQCVSGACTRDGVDGSADTGGGGDPSTDAASTGDAATADAAPPDGPAIDPACATTDTCIAAVTLGAVSGDTGHQVLHASGTTAAWFRVRVTEDDDDIAGHSLRIAAALTPPAAAGFEIDVYVDAATDHVECAAAAGVHSTSGSVKLVRAEWGETAVANGVNDSRDVSIAIRPTGACAPDAPWQLAVEGDWN